MMFRAIRSTQRAAFDRIYSSSHIMQTVIIYSLANETKITCFVRCEVFPTSVLNYTQRVFDGEAWRMHMHKHTHTPVRTHCNTLSTEFSEIGFVCRSSSKCSKRQLRAA